ncbi:MAG: pyruvate kinase [Bacteroidota bacterium]
MRRKQKLNKLIGQIDHLITTIKEAESTHENYLDQVSPAYRNSARNLIHYRELRRHDIRDLQKKLGNMGMSRLAKAEAHVLRSLESQRIILKRLVDKGFKFDLKQLSIKKFNTLLNNRTVELLGKQPEGRRVRIMVTIPTDASKDYSLVHNLMMRGMNCARVNCAHDSPEVWLKIINNVRMASERLGLDCKVAMDLSGPKIRTGSIMPGPKVRKFSPERDHMGKVTHPSHVFLVKEIDEDSPENAITVAPEWLACLQPEDRIAFKDTRNKQRHLVVKEILEDSVLTYGYDAAYIATGTVLKVENRELMQTAVGELPPLNQYIMLKKGDHLIVHKSNEPGEPAYYNEDGNLLSSAHISCTFPALFDMVKTGENIFFDDGKISGIIRESTPDYFTVEIIHTKIAGSKLKADKGINLPNSQLNISGLSDKDRKDLAFVVKHADIVNMSFVNTSNDVKELLSELDRLKASKALGVVLKIETKKGFDNLTDILLNAMVGHPVGIMIARGDLAIETGWDNIARIQHDMLTLCNAAHLPVVWATQVLENLAKKGVPSRGEITDAATSTKAECVMLNKGAYTHQAITLLHNILRNTESYQHKNAPMLPEIKYAQKPERFDLKAV